MSEQLLDISSIRIDGDTQPRLAIDQVVVGEYASAMEAGAEFPAIHVVSDGAANWLVDGFHRYYAHRRLNRAQIRAEVTTGLLEEAQWLSLGANKAHGLRRTNEDKAKAVIKALKMKPGDSDHLIAKHVGVAQATVSKYRASIEEARRLREAKSQSPKQSVEQIVQLPARIGRDGKKYPVRPPSRPTLSRNALTPIRGPNAVGDRQHIGMSKDPAMGARALFETFDRTYIQNLVAELHALLEGRAGPPPTLRDIPQAQNN